MYKRLKNDCGVANINKAQLNRHNLPNTNKWYPYSNTKLSDFKLVKFKITPV